MNSTLRQQIGNIARKVQHWIPRDPAGFSLITGCPRSGTSALFYWLKEQPGVSGFYESRITIAAHNFLQCVDRFRHLAEHETTLIESTRKTVLDHYSQIRFLPGRVILEKEPLEPIAFPDQNYSSYLRSMRRLFPAMKLIFITRNVENTVWSMTQRTWGKSLAAPTEISLNIAEATRIWMDSYRLIQEMQSQPNTLSIQYEDLVACPADVSKQLCDFLGIPCQSPFVPVSGKTPNFSTEELKQIHEIAGSQA